MLQSLARNHKTIAWFLVTLFYLQLVAPVVARANTLAYEPFHGSYGAGTRKRSVISGKPFTNEISQKVSAVSATDKTVKKVKSPVHGKGVFTTGPTQPEMQSFQSVNSNNLVDPFSGDFSYNIPLLDVGGYPVNLHYQSGITMDQEASWVGLGWNINPGVVSRNMRGLPDDFQGIEKIEKTVSIKPNRTIGGVVGTGVEVFGGPLNVGGDVSVSVFHNTYKGWGLQTARNISVGIGVGSYGSLSAGLSMTNNTQNGTDISPSMGFQLGSKETVLQGGITIGTNYNTRTGIQNLQITGQMRAQANSYKYKAAVGVGTSFSSHISFSKPSYTPTISIPYNSIGWSFRFKGGVQGEGFFANGSLQGYMSTQEVVHPTLQLPAYGYMFYEKANKNPNVLLDFNREKDAYWTDNSPNIAVPIYTYDTWSISGEGTGGMFRAYRSDIGFMYDHKMETTSTNNNIGTDLGFGATFKAGADYQQINAVTKNNAWLGDNQLVNVIPFRSADTTFENVYFKNPGEKTAVDKVYQQALGGDNLMRVDLAASSNNQVVTATPQLSLFKNGRATSKISFDANTLRKQRDKRGQVISYLSAQEAAAVGLDKVIKNYGINSFPTSSCAGYTPIQRYDGVNRLQHHVSEISVLNADGRRYVYGIPVYNREQVDVTMATKTGDNSTGLVDYDPDSDAKPGNTNGKDGYFNREVIPAYSHSFLLSGILSSDYVDLTGDGITEDDMGDAVKFNYSEAYGLGVGEAYRWRAPYQEKKASYNEGLKTDSRDEKGSFAYGEREVWYLNSVESKTMIATFVLDADRKDGYGVTGENGGQGSQKLYKLKEINLYTKADLKKNGANARPIKTVHFEYSYELCKKNPGSFADSGKLTLKKVWFSYNNNFKGKRNPYVFTYGGPNPDFTLKSTDRWGNYKDASANPGKPGQVLTNADYPYTLQPGTNNWRASQADSASAPWTLNEIKLPSGGRLKVTYESDDYAYVQNKRAMQFFSIVGFGESETAQPKSNLYRSSGDYPVVFIRVTDPVNDKADVARKYLDGVTQLYLKMAVDMPGDNWGRGYELVPCYAEIEDYGVTNNQTIWVRVKPISAGKSPMAMAAIQFMRLNLPSKAYPTSEPGDKIDIRTAVNMLVNVSSFIVGLLKEANFDSKVRNSNKCNNVELDKSFVRLDNPIYKKYGGGLRVKKTEIFDNWNNMTAKTGKQQDSAVYGQTYTYTDTVLINGVETGISSGVASYEPMIGGDENPFHVPAKVYSEKVGAMAPTNYMYTEEPFAETFFPGPSVGYSKIRVQTIHRDKKSANGFDETEFYTSKDFPTLVEYTPIDNDSKKPFKTPSGNPFNFNVRNYVTLSQGFKIELNDMNGKPKSQSSYAQNDLNNPISYTYNYYRLENDNAGQPKLSNTVAIAESANGKIDLNGVIGKDVEVMVDVREQTSTTSSANIEGNLDIIGWGPFSIPIVTIIPLFNGETNRYRAVSVLKIVNRYGILDSVIHIEKGSRVTTRNLVYDGETGEVLLSQTNNEFDDPVYNFSYPAHWAYEGMGAAYSNIGTILKNVKFRKGIMRTASLDRVPADRYFKSGDELLVVGYDKRNSAIDDYCDENYYTFLQTNPPTYKKIWAIDASRGKQHQNGIYFIDEWGVPYSCDANFVRVIRSGKRNLAATEVGSITSLQTPVRLDNGVPRFVFDTATHVIAANAGRFKDMWAVDSTIFRKDTTIIATHRMVPQNVVLPADDYYSLQNYKGEGNNDDHNVIPAIDDINMFEASAYDNGKSSWDREVRSFLRFNMNGIPQGALITSATLHLYGNQDVPDVNDRTSNKSWIEHLNSGWVKEVINTATNDNDRRYAYYYYWDNPEPVDPDPNSKVLLPETPHGQDVARNETIDITPMARNMLHDLYADGNWPVIRIRLDQAGGGTNLLSRLTYNSNLNCQTQTQTFARALAAIPNSCMPTIELNYFPPCADGSQPYYLAQPPFGSDDPTPGGGYYCNLSRVDTFVCRPNINDTAVNPYRLGLLGNWRMDRAYSYYGSRMQTDPAAATEIRKDGVIKDFATYWTFNDNALMNGSTDTSRWVWNSELSRFNNKGFEIENHDPLDRYNSGQYGYNQTMPVAVAQNAKNREIAFDGFEDYGYSTDNCIKCVLNRHIDLGKDANLVDTVSHTGLYSRRVNGNEVGYATFNIGAPNEVKEAPEFSMKEDSVPLVSTRVIGNGGGLNNYYYTIGDGCYPYADNKPALYTGVNSNVDYWIRQKPLPSSLCRTTQIYYSFQGFIQPRYTGTYKFWVTTDDIMSIYIWVNGESRRITQGRTMEQTNRSQQSYLTAYETETVTLQAGELYPIQVLWDNYASDYGAKIEWESQGLQSQAREIVPTTQFYPEGTDAATTKQNTVFNDTTWCVKFNNPTGTHLTHKRFSPIQGQKVVVSAWVKQDQPCVSGNYDNAAISLAFNNSTGANYFNFTPTGNIIEGWQRIEDTLTIPAGATSMTMNLSATSGVPVFFDDIRVQPFNANMKSFVYNPVNLRLMAELDENNYATFYEYDDEGTLIRVKKETEKGIKTIKETRSALLKE